MIGSTNVDELLVALLPKFVIIVIMFYGLRLGISHIEKMIGSPNRKTHGESGDDWLSEQLNAERQAKRRTSTMLGIETDNRRESAAERLRREHERNCAADRLRYAHAENCDAEAVREDSARATRQQISRGFPTSVSGG